MLSQFRSRSLTRMVAVVTASAMCLPAFAVEPIPNTYIDLPVPQLTGWNDVNTQTVDGITGATGKTFIYPDEATRDADLIDWATFDPAVDHYGVGSVAFIYWELDDGSGRAPGMKTVTDDFEFPVNNCIMASGERESTEFPGTVVPKTCSDPQGSSKRYKLEVTESDVPIDLVFDLGVKDIRYKGIKDPADDGGEALETFKETYGIGRIYRVIQKVINNTDDRWVSVKFELGTGVGAAFTPLTYANDGVAFELREAVPREFFEGETGAPDIVVWEPERFATFSPKVFDDGVRERFDPGFFDDQPAGLFPPQDVQVNADLKSQYINSGTTIVNGIAGAVTPNYFDMTANQAAGAGLTGNLFGYMFPDSLIPTVIAVHEDGNAETESDAILAWWDGADWRYGEAGPDDTRGTADDFSVVPLAQLEQWAEKLLGRELPIAETDRYESIPSDDVSGLNTDAFIYIGDKLLDETTGQPKIDSITMRITPTSTAAAGLGGTAGDLDPAWIANPAPELASYIADTGTPIAINDIATTIEVDPVTINVIQNDLLDGETIDPLTVTNVTISTGPTNGTAQVNGDFTVTYTANPDYVGTELFYYTVTLDDGLGGTVTSSPAMIKVYVEAEPEPDAPIANNDSANILAGDVAIIDVLANDTIEGLPVPRDAFTSVAIKDAPLNGSARVENNIVIYTPNSSFVGYERFTYTVTVGDKLSNAALVTVQVGTPGEVPPPTTPVVFVDSDSSGGCTVGSANRPLDPTLPAMLALALAGLLLRRRRQSI